MAVRPASGHPWRTFAISGSGKGTKEKRAKTTRPAKRSAKREPCEYIMQRLRIEYELEFIYSKLSRRGRSMVMNYARLMLKWEEAGPRKVREIDRLRAKKIPVPLSRKYSASGDLDADVMLDDEAEEMGGVDEVDDVVLVMSGGGEPEK